VLALSEMDVNAAAAELRYAAPALERAASRAVPAADYPGGGMSSRSAR
jgi:hypothetical protein